MNKNVWIFIFVIALSFHLFGILLANETIQFVSKPLIVIGLIGYFIVATKGTGKGLGTWIVLALFFSLTGDLLLIFQQQKSLFFLLGLSAFLLAHIFYIIFFHGVRIRESIAGRWWLLLIVVLYYALLMALLSDYLGNMKLPVRIYGVVISFMLMLGLHMYYLKIKNAGWLLLLGALLFVISDSVLAINKFYRPFEQADFFTMLTYGIAQLFITKGAAEYITSVSKR